MAYLCSMKINNDFLRQSADTVEGITQLLSRFDDKREGLTLIYLLSLADSKGEVTSTIYAMAKRWWRNSATTGPNPTTPSPKCASNYNAHGARNYDSPHGQETTKPSYIITTTMTKQLALLPLNSSQTLSAQPSKRQNALSVNQKSDGEAFLRIFPSEREVLAYFAPAKWAAADRKSQGERY